MYYVSLVKFINNFNNNNLPPFMLNLSLNRNSELSNYSNTRYARNLLKIHCHASSIMSSIPKLLNDSLFPELIRRKIMCPDVRYGTSHIVRSYKSFLISQYSGVQSCFNKSCYPCMFNK